MASAFGQSRYIHAFQIGAVAQRHGFALNRALRAFAGGGVKIRHRRNGDSPRFGRFHNGGGEGVLTGLFHSRRQA